MLRVVADVNPDSVVCPGRAAILQGRRGHEVAVVASDYGQVGECAIAELHGQELLDGALSAFARGDSCTGFASEAGTS